MFWKTGVKRPEAAKKAGTLSEQVIIRSLVEDDLPALEWDGEFTHFRRVYADAYQRMMHGYTLIWVADLPGTGILGQVFIQLTCDRPELADGVDRAYLYSFRVRTPYRKMGIGSRMMDVVENDLFMRGFQYVTLNVARDNPRAQELYVRRGFYVVAPEPGTWSYPDDQGVWHQMNEPAWRMEKVLYLNHLR